MKYLEPEEWILVAGLFSEDKISCSGTSIDAGYFIRRLCRSVTQDDRFKARLKELELEAKREAFEKEAKPEKIDGRAEKKSKEPAKAK